MARRPYNVREITIDMERTLLDDFGETAFAILRNLIFASPVGNPNLWQNPGSAPEGYTGGHFRRNWTVSINRFSNIVKEGNDAAGAATFAEGKVIIDRYVARKKPRLKLIIQNNVPYAGRLASGHSTQAAEGWVNDAIAAAMHKISRTKEI